MSRSSSFRSRRQPLDHMANTPSPAPLPPLSETSSHEHDSLRQLASSSSRSSTARSFDPMAPFAQTRRRRPASRFLSTSENRRADPDVGPSSANSVASSSNSIQALLNPEAVDFVPGVRMPSKRKASPSARPSKSVLNTPRSSSSLSAPVEQPLIRADEIFGRDTLIESAGNEIEVAIDDDDHSEIFDLEIPDENILGVHSAQRLQDIRALLRNRTQSADKKKSQHAFSCASAILFSYDPASSMSHGAADSARLRYLPLQPLGVGRREPITKDSTLTIVPSHRRRIDAVSITTTERQVTWPCGMLPVEIFDLVTDSLSRDDVKSMRLVSKEFEEKVSRTLFHTSVVPFNTELYDMIDEDTRAVTRVVRRISKNKDKGKGRARDIPGQPEGLPTGLHWQNAREDAEGKVYKGHGLSVFRGFGPHIRKFGMTFEVAEGQLARTPIKKELDHVESYFGSYDWPHHQYTRFAGLAGLECTADDTMRMKAAFANLKKVQELALSIDGGLGWLNGPDRSIRAQIFDRPSTVFGSTWKVPDRQMHEALDFWSALESSSPPGRLSVLMLKSMPQDQAPSDIPGLQGTQYANTRFWGAISADKVLASNGTESSIEEMRHGILYTTSINPEAATTPVPAFDKSSLVPADLRKEQKEWLLETEWAQRAFLECYVLAIMDNPTIFGNVKTLKLAKISSGFLPLLARSTFWDALPNLLDVTVHVKADWRSVERDNAGYAEVCSQNPSEAARLFYQDILRDRICLRPSITKLNIGWVGGGEHAEGLFARNANVLPAPITPLEFTDSRQASGSLIFNFVEHLILTNCWLTPPALEELVLNHSTKALRKLTLDSVSLTAHPRFPVNGQVAPQLALAPALQALQPGVAQGQQPGWLNIMNQNQNGQAPLLQWPPPWLNLANQNLQAPGGLHAHQLQAAPHFAQHAAQQALVQAQNLAAVQNGQAGAQPGGAGIPGAQINAAQAQALNQQPVAPPPGQQGLAWMPPPQQPPPPVMLAAQQAHSNSFTHWTEAHREGSWPHVLDKISCGAVFTDYLPQPAPWEEQLPMRAETKLRTIELNSCGYVKLMNNTSFDQTGIIATRYEMGLPVFFRERHAGLAPAMMSATDRYLGRIMQFMQPRELNALLFAWGMTEGWADRAKSEEAEYDGMARGGTGRFSGRIDKGMSLVGAPVAPA